MLRWRLTFGSVFVAVLAALCWADAQVPRPGAILAGLALVLCVLATGELLTLVRKSGRDPVPWSTYLGTLLPVAASCLPIFWNDYPPDSPVGRVGLIACGFAIAIILALVGELLRFEQPGQTLANLGATALSVLYLGGMLSFLVQLRQLPAERWVAAGQAWAGEGTLGLIVLLSLVGIVKLSDMGQYFVGHRFGRRKLAPTVSPGKTIEGSLGGILLATIVGSVVFSLILHGKTGLQPAHLLAWMLYAVAVCIAGVVGDLAESMLKRDAGVKDSSNWLPGLGGVLDMLDSLLLAAPVAYACWVSGLLGP